MVRKVREVINFVVRVVKEGKKVREVTEVWVVRLVLRGKKLIVWKSPPPDELNPSLNHAAAQVVEIKTKMIDYTEVSFLSNCTFCAQAGYIEVYKKCSLIKMNHR